MQKIVSAKINLQEIYIKPFLLDSFYGNAYEFPSFIKHDSCCL